MSRYDWPRPGRGSPDRLAARQQWLAARARHDPAATAAAFQARHAVQAPSILPRDVPAGPQDLWVPVGPSAVLLGQAGNRPRVSGRVRALAVSDDGTRVYAGTANGGLWYSDDAGETWLPVGLFVSERGGLTRPFETAAGAQGMTVGALLVTFDKAGNTAKDVVVVGTGETTGRWRQSGYLGGAGVLVATGPVAAVRADPSANPWIREAKNLIGMGIYRLAADPDRPDHLIAATSRGLFLRSLPAAADSNWTQVRTGPFNAADSADGPLRVTNVVWAKPQTAGSRLWVGLDDERAPIGAGASGIWVAPVDPAGTRGAFTPVTLPGLTPRTRIGLAAGAPPSAVLYALGLTGPLATADAGLWRIDDSASPPAVNAVGHMPLRLFGAPGPGQHDYDLTLAVDPTDETRVVLGGSLIWDSTDWSASLFADSVSAGGPTGYQLSFAGTAGKESADPTWRGGGVHPDVHVAVFARTTEDQDSRDLWVGCDGGVFASHRSGAAGTFVARNTGIASLEVGWLASSPASDVDMVVGTQDNGTLRRVGESVWQVVFESDGGGVVYDPQRPDRFARQNTQTDWEDNASTLLRFVFRSGNTQSPPQDEKDEQNASEFYSGAAAAVSNGRTLLAIGSTRLWVSDAWGAAGSWVTLPTGRDPKVAVPADTATDLCVPGTGGTLLWDTAVVTVRWPVPGRLLVLCRRAVIVHHVTDDATATPPLTSQAVRVDQVSTDGKIKHRGSAGVAQHFLPTSCAWTDIASHDPAAGTHGSFYVATTGPEDLSGTSLPDTLWWFDGTDTWYATGLRTDKNGSAAPAQAVLVDPADPSVVYAGTGAGVWRATFDRDAKSWHWAVFSNGLPEASVSDLELVTAGGARLLRAAVQALGVYEVDLARPAAARTYLRVHALDSRRADRSTLTDPRTNPAGTLPWDASPDVRPRPALGAPVPADPAADGGTDITGDPVSQADRYRLWVFQTAHHFIDPLVRADGRWSSAFAGRLKILRDALGLADPVRVDAPVWHAMVKPAFAFVPPWASAPTEADLLELVTDAPPPAGDPASLALPRGPVSVDVLVHHRDAVGVDGPTVRVVLLRHALGAAPDNGAALPATWQGPVKAALDSGTPPAGLQDGWSVADAGTPVRSPAGLLHPRNPRAVTFSLDLTAEPAGSRLMLLAVVASGVDPAAFTGATIPDLVLVSHGVAARSVCLT